MQPFIGRIVNGKGTGLTNINLSEEELNELEREASQPTIEDQGDTLDKEIEDVKKKLYNLQIKRLKL